VAVELIAMRAGADWLLARVVQGFGEVAPRLSRSSMFLRGAETIHPSD
jgi:hypothetical protein